MSRNHIESHKESMYETGCFGVLESRGETSHVGVILQYDKGNARNRSGIMKVEEK